MTISPREARIEIRWEALRPAAPGSGAVTERVAFVLIVRPVDEQHVLVEAWRETPRGPRSVLGGGPASGAIERDGGFLHLDVHRNGRRIVALTLEAGAERPRYASSPLLAEAGFAPGSFDPPRIRVAAVEQDVASA